MSESNNVAQLSLSGNHRECLQACRDLLNDNPGDLTALKFSGRSLIALGQFHEAREFLVKAEGLNRNDREILKDLGNIAVELGDSEAAAQWYEKAIQVSHDYAPAINNLANLKRQSGDVQGAVDLFRQAIQSDPTLIQSYVGLTAGLLDLGDFGQAELFSRQALAINDKMPGLHEVLGMIFQDHGYPAKAFEYFQGELTINSQSVNSLLGLGILHLENGQAAVAVKFLTQASALQPSLQCSLLLAQAHQALGRFKEAVVEYQKINIDQLHDKMAFLNYGICLLNINDNSAAIEAFRLALNLDKSLVSAWGNLGNALKREGRYQEALSATLKVLEIQPDHPEALMNLGVLHQRLGNLDQALESILKLLKLRPDSPAAHINLGAIYQDLGNLDQALSFTLQSLELKPDNPTALINLGSIQRELGQLDEALVTTLKALEIQPDSMTLI